MHNPGYYVLSARVDERVSHVMIRNKDEKFDVGGGPTFSSLNDLVENYKKSPMVETSGVVIHLKHPFHATSFLPGNINTRVTELQKQNQDVYGKAGFWEEFEVCICAGLIVVTVVLCCIAMLSGLLHVCVLCSFFSKWSANISTVVVKELGPRINPRTDTRTSCPVREYGCGYVCGWWYVCMCMVSAGYRM